ncbi:hypothetical protein DVH24_008713 [Malus domestica]|uniref:ELK domain-containing protein n=1 Tax=Malus domestica TaxID=3750 RepID=A0A498JJV3_MALDO|nr:hypothetical protein DVH24_008713 [Malus domestica]
MADIWTIEPCGSFIADNSSAVISKFIGRRRLEWRRGEIEGQDSPRTKEDQELKDKLLRKYSGYISTRKHEFSKSPRRRRKETSQKKQGKFSLIGGTFIINGLTQRKRHWKPSENMQKRHLAIYRPIFTLCI